MTVRELKELLEDYPDNLEILIGTSNGYDAFDVIASVGILDYWGDEPIYSDDFSDFIYAALEEHGKDVDDDGAIADIMAVYEEELTPKLILE